jgi:hypothetical protein
VGILNAEPAREDARFTGVWLVLVSAALALALAAAAWFLLSGGEPNAPTRTFTSESFGCRFEYPSGFMSGPNFVRSTSGAFLTVERHSLEDAKRTFVEELPDVLFPQVKIQLDQSYHDLREISRAHGTLGGRPSLHVELEGHAGQASTRTRISVDIAASEEWVYVLRSYSPGEEGGADRDAFDVVRQSFEFLR